ncbi:GNAT family N-acetyltransferase [Vineibacter terrae]|uniref:GNAT family N-acetyltransferase n=1 Tax=Vineibacter terrae TaxID=2586908 RepID=A0A5C8PV53_9HYPH|nr:GNAT family N-acetyltransferase [Vineibacter terrae]TXL81853.1 GNAT family N-acetyltransferase [Vineibacter terrae]
MTSTWLDVAPGKIASVVTALEMTARPARRPVPATDRFAVRRVARPALDWYRDLFRRIGTHWLWFSRLRLDDARLGAILHDPAVEVSALTVEGRDEGLLELDFRVPGEVELAFFGVAPEQVGRGAGRLLMDVALERAWAAQPRRVWVHTCTLDHPDALAFYQRSGFVPYRRQVEIEDDPRLDGTLPTDAAPQVPMIRPISD